MAEVTTETKAAKSFDAEAFAMNLAKAMESSGQALAAYLKPRENGGAKDKPPSELTEIIKTFGTVADYWLTDQTRAAGNAPRDCDRVSTSLPPRATAKDHVSGPVAGLADLGVVPEVADEPRGRCEVVAGQSRRLWPGWVLQECLTLDRRNSPRSSLRSSRLGSQSKS